MVYSGLEILVFSPITAGLNYLKGNIHSFINTD